MPRSVEHPALFGTDGFRGRFTTEQGPGCMNEETIKMLASIAYRALQQAPDSNSGNLFIVGRDTRPSGSMLKRAATIGLMSAGAKVIDVGVLPTPAILRAAKHFEATGAIAITASHNPVQDNGFKVSTGPDKLSTEAAQDIDRKYWGAVDMGDHSTAGHYDRLGIVKYHPEYEQTYIKDVVDAIEQEFGSLPLYGHNLVIDGGYGAASSPAPNVFELLGAQVHPFACDTSQPINDGAGATNLDGVKEYIKSLPQDINDGRFLGALSFDGDADRVMGLSGGPDYRIIDGNMVMELRSKNQIGVVGTEYTNPASIHRIRQQGRFVLCPNGDIHVTKALRDLQNSDPKWRFGGEFTGHHVDLNWLSSGDGIYTGAWLAAYTASQGKTFRDIANELPLWPETMHKLHISDKSILDRPEIQGELHHVRQQLGNMGALVIRFSGTEANTLRIWGSAESRENLSLIDNLASRIMSTKEAA